MKRFYRGQFVTITPTPYAISRRHKHSDADIAEARIYQNTSRRDGVQYVKIGNWIELIEDRYLTVQPTWVPGYRVLCKGEYLGTIVGYEHGHVEVLSVHTNGRLKRTVYAISEVEVL